MRCPNRAHHDREWSASYAVGVDGLTVVMTCHASRCSFDHMLAGLGLPKGALTASRISPQGWRAERPQFYGGAARRMHDNLMADTELAYEVCSKLGCTPQALKLYLVGVNREGRLTFPERDKRGDVIGYARHLPYWDDRRKNRYEYKTLSNGPRGLCMPDRDLAPDMDILVVEGPALAPVTAAVGSVRGSRLWESVAIPSAGSFGRGQVAAFPSRARVYVVVDHDEPGRVNGDLVARELARRDGPTYLLDLAPDRDDKTDLGDLVLALGRPEVRQLVREQMRTARPYPKPGPGRPPIKRGQCERLLTSLMADEEWHLSRDIFDHVVVKHGYSSKVYYAARKALRIGSDERWNGQSNVWYSRLNLRLSPANDADC